MILSASGWRKVFAETGNENDSTDKIGKENELLCALAGETFAGFIKEKTKKSRPVVALAKDTRPTGKLISEILIKALFYSGIKVLYAGTASAPEIMAWAKKADGFVYVSASHNPIGHNGIKFGLNDGGVLDGESAKKLIKDFESRLCAMNAETHAQEMLSVDEKKIQKILNSREENKKDALESYSQFLTKVITGLDSPKKQEEILSRIKYALKQEKLGVACDMNGSARCVSIDRDFLENLSLDFETFNDREGKIAHEIIPEPENLVHVAAKLSELQAEGKSEYTLGYMPDCDGDRGNTVWWDSDEKKAKIITAQQVFALCVMSELAYQTWLYGGSFFERRKLKKLAVCVNCHTSMRIDEIADAFKAKVFRAEVGEANVVNLAREKRKKGFLVRILGEGSNGGNITYPSSVRDPLSTILAIIKLLTLRDTIEKNGSIKKGLFHIWCEKSGQEKSYKSNFTLSDILKTLPVYTTTGVSESRAVLKVNCTDMGKLKLRFQKFFEEEWKNRRSEFSQKYGIESWDCCTTNGTKEIKGATDWSNGRGGLKVRFFDSKKNPAAFIWMRPSGTESVFRIMCDVKGEKPQTEQSLLEWETSLLKKADSF
ncbi:MAG: phosphoglucomutase [Treponema sp.]|nr:phosphoglucomutase [Treponema sp.]